MLQKFMSQRQEKGAIGYFEDITYTIKKRLMTTTSQLKRHQTREGLKRQKKLEMYPSFQKRPLFPLCTLRFAHVTKGWSKYIG